MVMCGEMGLMLLCSLSTFKLCSGVMETLSGRAVVAAPRNAIILLEPNMVAEPDGNDLASRRDVGLTVLRNMTAALRSEYPLWRCV